MIKNIYTLIFWITFPFILNAQVENEKNWQFSYSGDLIIRHGVQVGYQIPLKNWNKVKTKKGQEITKYKSLNSGVDFSYYWQKQNHHGFTFSPYFAYQRIKQNGKYFQIKIGLGYHRSFVDGITYAVDDQGNVESKKFVGQNTFYNSLSFDFGKDLRIKKGKPIRWFLQFGLNGRFPYNKSYLPGIHTGAGIHYFFQKK